jgi:hypothetical protein
MTFAVIDNFLDNVEEHLTSILDGQFIDYDSSSGVFKNIQDRGFDSVAERLINLIYNTSVSYNFARLSPEGQQEPNFIHDDSMMGDLTCILYLSKDHPAEDGTTIYDSDCVTKCVEIRGKFNRMIIFDSNLPHSRNIFSNFGEGKSSRLIQVIFLNKN